MKTQSRTATDLNRTEIVRLMDGQLRSHPDEPDRLDAYLPSPCIQNHAPNLSWLPDGSLACVWFGGSMEGKADISIWLSTLAPNAEMWSQAVRLTDDADRSEQNPILFTDRDGRLHLFHTAQPGGRQDLCEIRHHRSVDDKPNFTQSSTLTPFAGVFVRQPLQIGPHGEWLMPGFRCRTEPDGGWSGGEDTALVLISSDEGQSWRAQAVPDSVGAVHMCMVPGVNGKMLAFFRDRFARCVRRSASSDGGLSWTAPEATPLPNNNSSIQAIRRQDGRIAMVLNPINAEMSKERRHSLYDDLDGPPNTSAAIWGVPRAPLSLVHSTDEGITLTERRDLDTGPGTCLTNNSKSGENREFSYPSVLEDEEGNLHIAYTYHRRAIKYVRLAAQ